MVNQVKSEARPASHDYETLIKRFWHGVEDIKRPGGRRRALEEAIARCENPVPNQEQPRDSEGANE